MDESYEALEQIRSVRDQLKELAPKAQGKAKNKSKLTEAMASFDKQCAELEGATQRSFFGLPPSGKRPENLSTLNQHFAAILAIADSADAAPTTQATAVEQELEQQGGILRKQWSVLRETAIPSLNKNLRKAGLPTIDPKKPLSEELGGASDGDDEP